MTMRRLLAAAALNMLLLLVSSPTGFAADSSDPPVVPLSASPSPEPTPDPLGDFTHVPGTGALSDLDWRPVTEPALEPGAPLSRLPAWAGGFAAIEGRRDLEAGWQHAIWSSRDGLGWTRSPLPARVRRTWWLLPFRDGLVLATSRDRRYMDKSFRLDIWRSADGMSWRHTGSVHAALPARLERERNWHLWPVDLIATEDGLTLLARVTYAQGTGGSTREVTQFVSNRGALRARANRHPDRVWGWRSRDGSRWVRRPVRGVVRRRGSGAIDLATLTPDGIIARQVAGTESLLSSKDGLRWTFFAPLPADFEWGGSEALLWTDGAPLLLSDNDDEQGNEGCGNRLGAWRLGEDEVWAEILDRQPAFVHGAAADGRWVILTGKSWCAGEWAWILVSSDGGRTWDPDLSWTGRRGTCRGEAAVHGGTAIVLACTRDRSRTTTADPLMWWAQLPPPSASTPVVSQPLPRDGTMGLSPSWTSQKAVPPG
ncbi:MAG: hypothetical protein ACC726_08360 [Chloroflexota bacterium]